MNQTPLYQQHLAAHGKMVDFAGWQMPLHYGSQIEEHHQVRNDAGVFDVSHMTIVDVTGDSACIFLRNLLANDVAKLQRPGKAMYSCILNEQGGVLDDLIVYFFSESFYRLVFNASTREKVLAWVHEKIDGFDVVITERREFAMVAVQGPQARQKIKQALTPDQCVLISDLKPFVAVQDDEWLFARTGYTGEDGLEIILPAKEAADFWQRLLAADIKPCGLGARDTLRLEAGMNLYGNDMDETVTPLESGLAWTVAWEPDNRKFIGRAALEKHQAQGIKQAFVGLILEDKGILRAHQQVIVDGLGEGEITSGGFSPTLNLSLALARVPEGTGSQCDVVVRQKLLKAKVVKPPFVRNGKAVYQDLI